MEFNAIRIYDQQCGYMKLYDIVSSLYLSLYILSWYTECITTNVVPNTQSDLILMLNYNIQVYEYL